LALRNFQGGEQRRRPVALVVVGHRATANRIPLSRMAGYSRPLVAVRWDN
jgi:hypothetical protein